MINRRQTKRLRAEKYSLYLMASLSTIGLFITAYLTIVKLNQSSVICPTKGCEKVLSSPYAELNGIPLSLFGFFAYLSILLLAIALLFVKGKFTKKVQGKIQLLLCIETTIVSLISIYLIYLVFFIIKAVCIYCLVSALLSFSLFAISLLGFTWEDIGELFFTLIVVGFVSSIGILGWHTNVNLSTTSSIAKVALAQHLNQIGAKMYGAFWCGHCQEQKQLFGKEAFSQINYIECDPQGENPQSALCEEAGITGFPTWEINNKLLVGVQPLNELARISNYSQVEIE